MHYLKVFTDFRETISALDDEEAGRLFRAMLRYAADGEQPALAGNERYLWPAAKQSVDREAETYGRICERNRANRAGGNAEASPKKRGAKAAKRAPENAERESSIANAERESSIVNAERECAQSAKTAHAKAERESSIVKGERENSIAKEEQERAIAKVERESTQSAQSASANADAAVVFDVSSRVVQDKDKDKEKENIRERLSEERTEKELPFPDAEEVGAYCREQGLNVDPAAFCRYYEASDWRDGFGRPVRSWKQKLLSWNSFSSGRSARASPAKSAPRPGMGSLAGYRQTPLSEADFEAMFVDLDHPLPEAQA